MKPFSPTSLRSSPSNNENLTSPGSHYLFALGSNGSGQLGIGHSEDVSVPTQCVIDSQLSAAGVHQIACGGNHTVAISRDHIFVITGENQYGENIASQSRNTNTFTERRMLHEVDSSSIRHIAATWTATFTSYSSENLYVSGLGNAGELGLGPGVKIAAEATRIEGLPGRSAGIRKIASCMGHVVVVLDNGEVWGWGKGRKGQIGMPADIVWQPRKIEGIDFDVVDAVCGKDFTCVFGDPAEGKYVIMGLTGNDRFGVKRDSPQSIVGWKQVAASWGSIYILLESGELLAWGRNDHGQLPPPSIPPLVVIAAGSEHCLGLTKDGKVLAWGWGEHGNCGMPIDGNGDVKGRWNELAVPHTVIAIFSGCATSFIETRIDRSLPQPTGTGG